MGNTLEKVKEQLNEFYHSLNKSQKIKIGVSALLIITSMALLFYFISRPEYKPLYSELTPKDAGEITKKLDEMGIPWKIDDTENKLLVPKEHYNKAKMNLAVEGLPKEKFSYEDMLNNSKLTMTNDERKKRYMIAQMNSLARTIEEIDGIRTAMVNLTVPDDSNFLMQDEKSKASVFVELEPGKTLSEEQVNGISMLVSNAVKNLEPENISIVDNTGQLLNKKTNSDQFNASTQLNLQQQVQEQLKDSITQFLSTVYGMGNVAVMVNAKLDFDSEVSDIQEFSPPIEGETNGLIRSMTDLKEKVINGAQGGIPGTDSNTEDITEYPENNEDISKYDKANKTINYEMNELKKKIVKAQGQIQDITVAVLINKKTLINQELTEENKQEISNLVSAAAGLDTKVVEVMAKDFDTSLADEFKNAKSSAKKSGIFGNLPLWPIALLLTFLLGGAGYAVYYFRRRKNTMEDMMADTAEHIEEEIEEIDLETDEKSSYKKQIEKFVDRKPEAVAQLLKTWLNED